MKISRASIGSIRKREVSQPQQHTEYYLFNSQSNLKAYSDDVMDFAYYGYNAANTRTYKLSLYNTNLWINGQQQPLNMQLQNAMFYPNTYLNFNGNGEYTKHYYNGTERIASRLGDNTITIALNNNILEDRKLSLEEHFREDIHKLIYETVPIDMPPFMDVNTLQPIGTPNDIYYYHPNHLGNTAFVTDQNQTITQGFLYAPFGEITTEYNINFGNNVIPKYSFNAKELDEETGMFYYEARYYAPPVFTSRDPHFEKYPNFSPYTYCYNNPLKYVDPTGKDGLVIVDEKNKTINVKVNIILYTKRLGTAKLPQAAKEYKKEIMDKWSKDENGNPWTVQHNGESYTIKLDVNVTVDQNSHKEENRNYNGINNYVEVESLGYRSSVTNSNTGIWALPRDGHNSASHEFGHLIGLKDRYNEYKTESGRSYTIPHKGWETNIMGIYEGKIEQKNFDELYNSVRKNINNTRVIKWHSLYVFFLNVKNRER